MGWVPRWPGLTAGGAGRELSQRRPLLWSPPPGPEPQPEPWAARTQRLERLRWKGKAGMFLKVKVWGGGREELGVAGAKAVAGRWLWLGSPSCWSLALAAWLLRRLHHGRL